MYLFELDVITYGYKVHFFYLNVIEGKSTLSSIDYKLRVIIPSHIHAEETMPIVRKQ